MAPVKIQSPAGGAAGNCNQVRQGEHNNIVNDVDVLPSTIFMQD